MRQDTSDHRAAYDREALIKDLVAVLGQAKVRWHPEDLIVYENDASVFRALADVIVFPETTAETAAVVKACNRHQAPVIPRGSGTGLAGGTVPLTGGVLLLTTKMHRILEIDLDSRLAVVQP
ncbi:MAG: FAD-binding oxidoreductase, partial [Thermaerobacterales bacterium]